MKNLQIIMAVVVVGVALIIWNLGRGNNTDDRQYVLEPQTNSEGEVSITVSPKNITSDRPWEFVISLDTHSGELNEDLTSVSVLIDDGSEEYKPISWQGDPPGGHHREGILKFNPVEPRPRTIKLIIRQIGGVQTRIFTWLISP